jgi:hypothetical protein
MVAIYYGSRLAKLGLKEEELLTIDADLVAHFEERNKAQTG